jgi:hypothetical protein
LLGFTGGGRQGAVRVSQSFFEVVSDTLVHAAEVHCGRGVCCNSYAFTRGLAVGSTVSAVAYVRDFDTAQR